MAVDGVDRTAEVRGPDVDVAVSAISGVAELRLALLRASAGCDDGRIIMAGRDIGTVVLPDADLKIYLDASVEERAHRRVLERGIDPDSPAAAEILEELRRRDGLDSSRKIAPLRAAEDALVIRRTATPSRRRSRSSSARSGGGGGGGAGERQVPAAPRRRPAAPSPDRAVRNGSHRLAPSARARTAAPRAERRQIQQTPVATRIDSIVGLGSAVSG